MNATAPFASQDAQAVAFLKRYRGAMFYAIRRIIADQYTQDDVYQMASMRILAAFRQGLKHQDYLLSFAITVARNAALDHVRELQRDGRLVGISEGYEHADPALDPSRQLMRLQSHEQLHACVECLPAMQRAVMREVIKGITLKEVAEHYEMSQGAVKVIAHRARLRIREMLTDPRYK